MTADRHKAVSDGVANSFDVWLSQHDMRLRTAAEIMAESEQSRTPATTDTERWLRSMEAYDAFTDVLLKRLNEADPGNGHGIGRVGS